MTLRWLFGRCRCRWHDERRREGVRDAIGDPLYSVDTPNIYVETDDSSATIFAMPLLPNTTSVVTASAHIVGRRASETAAKLQVARASMDVAVPPSEILPVTVILAPPPCACRATQLHAMCFEQTPAKSENSCRSPDLNTPAAILAPVVAALGHSLHRLFPNPQALNRRWQPRPRTALSLLSATLSSPCVSREAHLRWPARAPVSLRTWSIVGPGLRSPAGCVAPRSCAAIDRSLHVPTACSERPSVCTLGMATPSLVPSALAQRSQARQCMKASSPRTSTPQPSGTGGGGLWCNVVSNRVVLGATTVLCCWTECRGSKK